MGDAVGPCCTAAKISAISYLFVFFFTFFDTLVIMGDTERPRYTGFRGLSVCGITVLQCIWNNRNLKIIKKKICPNYVFNKKKLLWENTVWEIKSWLYSASLTHNWKVKVLSLSICTRSLVYRGLSIKKVYLIINSDQASLIPAGPRSAIGRAPDS